MSEFVSCILPLSTFLWWNYYGYSLHRAFCEPMHDALGKFQSSFYSNAKALLFARTFPRTFPPLRSSLPTTVWRPPALTDSFVHERSTVNCLRARNSSRWIIQSGLVQVHLPTLGFRQCGLRGRSAKWTYPSFVSRGQARGRSLCLLNFLGKVLGNVWEIERVEVFVSCCDGPISWLLLLRLLRAPVCGLVEDETDWSWTWLKWQQTSW